MVRRVLVAVLVAVAAWPATAAAAGRCGDRPWCDPRLSPDERAGLLLRALTPEERIGLLAGDDLTGVAGGEHQHTGTLAGVPRVGLPPVFFSDGPVGPRQGQATAMPAPLSLAATFGRDQARRHAATIGDEVRKKGNDVVYAPAVNMQRTPRNGRTFEYFGEDPYLAAQMAVAWTKGIQGEGVIGNVKHFAVNNQEGIGANPPGAPVGAATLGSRVTVDARLDERTLREIYLPQFEAAVREGGVGSVMCAYNRVNGQYACENRHLLQDVLRDDWGFDGFVLTDYGAAKTTAASLQNGLDLDIWPGFVYRPEAVRAAMAAGQADQGLVDAHVRATLRTLFAFGFFDREAYANDASRIDRQAHHAVAGELEEHGIVLLENDGGILPLEPRRIGRLALIGPEVEALKNGGGSSAIRPYLTTTPRQGIEARMGAGQVVVDNGSDRARAAAAAKAADVAVVVVGDTMSEGSDKPCLGLNCGATDGIDRDALIEAVAAAQPRTVVVLQTGGPVLTPWRDRVAGLLEAWYPGQNGGTAIARVLFGETEPGGRLPTTFPLREEDEPYAGDPNRYPGVAERVQYAEGPFIGYRWFDERRLGVAYPFGHGLTYTSFAFSDLRATAEGSRVVVRATVTNTGGRAGTAVPQLYVGMPDPAPGVEQPPLQLKGFERVALAPGRSRRVSFPLDDRAFSYWDEAQDDWRVAPGCYRIAVGASSRDLPLRGVVSRRDAACAGALAGEPPASCAPAGGLRRVAARPVAGGRLRLGFARRVRRPVTVDVFRVAAGRRVTGERRVARYARRSAGVVWPARGQRDGVYVVRWTMALRGGRRDVRRAVVVRSGGRFRVRPAYATRGSCGVLRSFKLERPVFGGATGTPLRLAFRLRESARVTVEVLRGGRVVRRLGSSKRAAGRTHRLRVPAAGLRRGDHRVRLTVVAGRRRVVRSLTARRL